MRKRKTHFIDWRDLNDLGLWDDNMATQICIWWLENGSKDCQHKDSDFKDSAMKTKSEKFVRHCSIAYFTRVHSCRPTGEPASARGFVTRLQPVGCIALLANWLVYSQTHSQHWFQQLKEDRNKDIGT